MQLSHKLLMGGFLLSTTALTATPAMADPITFIVGALSSTLNILGASVATQALIGGALLSTVGQAVVGLALNFAVQYALGAIFDKDVASPPPEKSQSNFRSPAGGRFYLDGVGAQGGNIVFAAVVAGQLFMLLAHGDAEVNNHIETYLAGIPVVVDGTGYVETEGFVAGAAKYYKIVNRPGTVTQAAMPELTAAFPEWTSNHRGAGVNDSLMIVDSIPGASRQLLQTFQGPLGIGTPDLKRIAGYAFHYDPRLDDTNGGTGPQRLDDPTTWSPSVGNPALAWARYRLDKDRFENDSTDIVWSWVASAADICDEDVDGKPRYRCFLSLNKKEVSNLDGETLILGTMDGIRLVDSQGRIGVSAGKYDPNPTLVLTDDDIFGIQSQGGEDGETLATHRSMAYVEPAYGYNETNSDTYVSPHYVEGRTKNFENPQLYQCQDHDQAMRLLKIDTLRKAATKYQIPSTVKAMEAREHRFLSLNTSDPLLNGVYEIAPVDDNYGGLSMQLSLIRVESDWWNRDAGEVWTRPNINISIDTDDTIANIDDNDMVISTVAITGSGGSLAQMVATFPAPAIASRFVQIQNRLVGTTLWDEFSVRTEDGKGTSNTVSDGVDQEIQWRVVAITGSSSPWSAIRTVTTTADTTPPAALTNVLAPTFGTGDVSFSWTTSDSANYGATRIYRADGLAATFASASIVRTEFGFQDQPETYTDTVAAGDYTYWLVPINKSDVEGAQEGPFSGTVT